MGECLAVALCAGKLDDLNVACPFGTGLSGFIACARLGRLGLNFRNLRNFHRHALNFRGVRSPFIGIGLWLKNLTPVCESCETCESFWFAPVAGKSGTELPILATHHAPSFQRPPTPLGGSSHRPVRLPRFGSGVRAIRESPQVGAPSSCR